MNERDIARFWSKVERRGPDECWPWTAAVDKDGYGKMKLRDGSHVRSNRTVLFLANGAWPVFGCHICDNPGCCNGGHLFDGTPGQNVSDMVSKSRQARGEMVATSKLNRETVERIRGSSLGTIELSRLFGVCQATIRNARNGVTWRHL